MAPSLNVVDRGWEVKRHRRPEVPVCSRHELQTGICWAVGAKMQILAKAVSHKEMTCWIGSLISRAPWLIVCVFALGAPSGKAAPITWNLVNATFTGGGSASGSFVYDATSDKYSYIHIVTTSITGFPGQTYTAGNAASNAGELFLLTNSAGGFAYVLNFTFDLTNAGGSNPLVLLIGPMLGVPSQEFGCIDADCNLTSAPNRFNATGSVTSVPEPATWITFALTSVAIFSASRIRRIRR